MSAGRYFFLLIAWLALMVGAITRTEPLVEAGCVMLGFLLGWDLVEFIKWGIAKATGGEA